MRCSFQSLLSWQLHFMVLCPLREQKQPFHPSKPGWMTSLAAPPDSWVFICPGFPLLSQLHCRSRGTRWPELGSIPLCDLGGVTLLPPVLCCVTLGWESQGWRRWSNGHCARGSRQRSPRVPPVPSRLPRLPTTRLCERKHRIPRPRPQEARANSWSAFNDPKPLYWLRRLLNLSQG